MHRIDGPGATLDGLFTEGDPVAGTPATVVTDDFLNDVQEELISILTAAGVTPVKGTQDQVLNSIVAALRATAAQAQALTDNTKIVTPLRLADAFKGGNVSLSINGYQKLPSGLIVQWGIINVPVNSTATASLPIAFPTAALHAVCVHDNPDSAVYPTTAQNFPSLSTIRIGAKAASGTTYFIRYIAVGY